MAAARPDQPRRRAASRVCKDITVLKALPRLFRALAGLGLALAELLGVVAKEPRPLLVVAHGEVAHDLLVGRQARLPLRWRPVGATARAQIMVPLPGLESLGDSRAGDLTLDDVVGPPSAFTVARAGNLRALGLLSDDGSASVVTAGEYADFIANAIGSPGSADALAVVLYSVSYTNRERAPEIEKTTHAAAVTLARACLEAARALVDAIDDDVPLVVLAAQQHPPAFARRRDGWRRPTDRLARRSNGWPSRSPRRNRPAAPVPAGAPAPGCGRPRTWLPSDRRAPPRHQPIGAPRWCRRESRDDGS